MTREQRRFLEAVRIDQAADAFARGEFAGRVLLVGAFFAAA